MAGTLVGRYELEFPLGHGAMGEVWRGRDLATRQPVAVKLVQLANIDDQVRLGETIYIKFDGVNENGSNANPPYEGPFTLEWSEQS